MTFLSTLPKSHDLKKLMKSLAVLDAIMSPEWDFRYYSFDSKWGSNESMGSIRNGSGDDVFVLFNDAGCFVKGFSHEYESLENPRAFYKNVPTQFSEATKEPAFTTDNVSFSFWHLIGEVEWKYSVAPSSLNSDIFFLLQDLDGKPDSYVEFSEDYYEVKPNIEVVKSIYEHLPLSEELVTTLNPEAGYSALQMEILNIGYPA